MYFYLIGIDHKSISFDKREALYFKQKAIKQFWADREENTAFLITCNRIEIYTSAKNQVTAKRNSDDFNALFPEFGQGYTVYGEKDVFLHVLKLACGLKSQLKGELQILKQLETLSSNAPLAISGLIGKAIEQSKKIRYQTNLMNSKRNAAQLIIEDIFNSLGQEDRLNIVIVGTGKFAQLFSDIKWNNADIYFAAHKNFKKAEQLAVNVNGVAVPLKNVPLLLRKADVVISATSSPHFIFKMDDFSQLSRSNDRPLYIYDFSFPRDVDPRIGAIPGIVLKNPIDINEMFEKWNCDINQSLKKAEQLADSLPAYSPQQRPIRIGIRPSPLALKQAEEICGQFPETNFEIIKIATLGDKDKITPLSQIEGQDFFTYEIEQALLKGEIDAAVHSAKDLENIMPEGLAIAAITKSLYPYECLVALHQFTLDSLPKGSRIGTSSKKRRDAVLQYRPDLEVGDIRGTIEERLKQLDEGKYDGVIIAHAALIRLGLEYRISQIIPSAIMTPHPLQGSLAVQVRANNNDLKKFFSSVNTHKNSRHPESREGSMMDKTELQYENQG